MSATDTSTNTLQWDSLILVVYSVLVGLSLDKNFDLFASSQNRLSSGILMAGLLLVILENWVYLPVYLKEINIDSTSEVTLYLVAVISYSCIPALYLERTGLWTLTASEWIVLNFAVICFIDAITKAYTIRKMRSKPISSFNENQRKIAGAYVFYAITGLFYAFLLLLEGVFLAKSGYEPLVKSVIVTGSWVLIRVFDRLLVPQTTNILLHFFWNGSEVCLENVPNSSQPTDARE